MIMSTFPQPAIFLTPLTFYSGFTSNIITFHFFALFHLYWPYCCYFLILDEITVLALFSAQQMLSEQSPTHFEKSSVTGY